MTKRSTSRQSATVIPFNAKRSDAKRAAAQRRRERKAAIREGKRLGLALDAYMKNTHLYTFFEEYWAIEAGFRNRIRSRPRRCDQRSKSSG
jgi:hypothetical protein